jgi:hypothetical protein
MTDDTAARITAVSREYFGLIALDPDAEQFMTTARGLADLIRKNQPATADPMQWELALCTAAAAFQMVSQTNPVPEEQERGVRATLMMLGAVGWLLGDGS